MGPERAVGAIGNSAPPFLPLEAILMTIFFPAREGSAAALSHGPVPRSRSVAAFHDESLVRCAGLPMASRSATNVSCK